MTTTGGGDGRPPLPQKGGAGRGATSSNANSPNNAEQGAASPPRRSVDGNGDGNHARDGSGEGDGSWFSLEDNFLSQLQSANEQAIAPGVSSFDHQEQDRATSPPRERRDRTVSWDANISEDSRGQLQRISERQEGAVPASVETKAQSAKNESRVSSAATVDASNLRPLQQSGALQQSASIRSQRLAVDEANNRRRINLADIVDANVELEAETFLLESLVENSINTSPADRLELDQQALLSHVPPSISHDFRQNSIGTTFSALTNPTVHQAANVYNDSSTSMAGSQSKRSPMPSPSHSRTHTPATITAPMPSTSTAAPSGSVLPTVAPSVRSVAPITPAQTPNHAQPKQQQQHRRQLTVEEKIFGLTSALSAMDGSTDSGRNHGAVEHEIGNPAGGSGDRLAHTVNLLFNRRRAKTEDSKVAAATGASPSAGTTQSPPTNGNNSNNNPSSVDPDPSGQGKHSHSGSAASANIGQNPQAPAGKNSPANSKWGKLRDNIDVYKKFDELPNEQMADESSHNGSKFGGDTPVSNTNPASNVNNTGNSNNNNNNVDLETGTLNTTGDIVDSDATIPAGTTANGADASSGSARPDGGGRTDSKRKSSRYNPFLYLPYGDKIKEEWDLAKEFLEPRQSSIFLYIKIVFGYLMIPLLITAFILYYLIDNPPTGKNPETRSDTASASWWVLFVVRNLVTFSFSKFVELIIIDYFCLNTRFVLNIFGPVFTLLVASSKGWPFLLSCWAMFDFFLLVGTHAFAQHWLYFQSYLDIFNDNNPAGGATVTDQFYTALVIALIVGITVSVKRLLVGLHLGRKTFSNYAESLSQVLDKMLLITEVAVLARDIEKRVWAQNAEQLYHYPQAIYNYALSPLNININARSSVHGHMPEEAPKLSSDDLAQLLQTTTAEELDDATPGIADGQNDGTGFQTIVSETGALTPADKARIVQLLGQWEDPKRAGGAKLGKVSVGAVLQFRRALARMDTYFPFSRSFGVADTRENCVASAQDVFLRLLLKTSDAESLVPFETLAGVAMDRRGKLDMEKVKKLIKVFRPERDGSLSLLEFVRSVDAVYKELRLLRATIDNSSQIDRALENIFNGFFYTMLAVIILFFLGFNPFTVFLSFSTVILSFTFMIGGASASYVEGLLFILVQRPYNIGDRINVSNSQTESPYTGSQGWIVENVTLFTTSIVLAATNERATVANGALSKSRIINCARSPDAVVFFNLKFGLDVPYSKIQVFKAALEKFVKARPREWLSLIGFRSTRVEADLGYYEYIGILQHRERWQNIGAILQSKAVVQQFCIELQKKMNMRYISPPLPVNLNMSGGTMPSMMPPAGGLAGRDEDTRQRDVNGANDLDASMRQRSDTQDVSASIFALFDGE